MSLKQLFAFLLGISFVVLAALQYQHPSAVLWITVYLAASIFSFMAALGRISRLILALAFVAYASGTIYLLPPPTSGNLLINMYPSIGLAFAAVSMVLLTLMTRKKEGLHPPHIPGHVKRWGKLT